MMFSSDFTRVSDGLFSTSDSLAIKKKFRIHLFDEQELMLFLKDRKAAIGLKGKRIEVEMGDGWISNAVQFEVNNQRFLLRVRHKGGNNGVAISENHILIGTEDRFVTIVRNLFNEKILEFS